MEVILCGPVSLMFHLPGLIAKRTRFCASGLVTAVIPFASDTIQYG
jgi:hypothetical protein